MNAWIVFGVRLVLSGLCVIPIFYFIQRNFAATTTPLSMPQIDSIMIPSVILLALWVTGVFRLTKHWAQEFAGELPDPEPSPERQKLGKAIIVIMLVGALAFVWYVNVPPRTTPLNVLFSAVLLGCATLILALSFYHKQIVSRYGGLACGFGLSGVIFSAPSQENFPTLLILILLIGPPGIGHVANTWWNSQDFVIEARRRKEREHELEEQKRQYAQQAAQEEATKQTVLDAIQPIASSPGARTREAEQLRAQLDELLKK